jgi:hypothetical protein
MADYHALGGIDAAAVQELLQGRGLVTECVMYATGRTQLTKIINRRVPLMQQLKILAQRQY